MSIIIFFKKTKKMVKNNDLSELWGEESLDAGWTAIPNSLIFLQSELKISSQELVVLLNIFIHRRTYKPNEFAFPSVRSIANRTGQSMRNVRRHLSSLEKKEFITRLRTTPADNTKGKNLYDVRPLIMQLRIRTPILNQNLQAFRQTNKQEDLENKKTH